MYEVLAMVVDKAHIKDEKDAGRWRDMTTRMSQFARLSDFYQTNTAPVSKKGKKQTSV